MLRTILIDDEKPALDLIERLLSANGSVEIVGKYTRPEEAIERVRTEEIDVVFLDIQMPGMNGIEAAEHLMEAISGIEIVFVTAYSQFATDAFELSAVDYVLKPVSAGRLNKTIARLLSRQTVEKHEWSTKKGESLGADESGRAGFYSFGHFEWMYDAETRSTVKWRTSKERELMAYLVFFRNKFVSKDKILEDLWPAANPEQSGAFLHTCVYNIRKKLNSLELGNMLEYRQNSYRLEMRDFWCDSDVFERKASVDTEIDSESIGEFEKIAKLYTGNYLEEDGFIWAHEVQERLKEMYIGLMKRMSEYYISLNKHQPARDCLRSALRKNPFLDDVNELMLIVYARMGDRLSMVRHYQQFTRLLKEELGIEPMESTVKLVQRLSSGSAGDI